MFVINARDGHVKVIDSNPYEHLGTVANDRHSEPRKMSGRTVKWPPNLIGRLSTALHDARPKIGIPKFGKWPFKVVGNSPKMSVGSNDCGFYVMKYMQCYDLDKSIFTSTIIQVWGNISFCPVILGVVSIYDLALTVLTLCSFVV